MIPKIEGKRYSQGKAKLRSDYESIFQMQIRSDTNRKPKKKLEHGKQ